MKAFLSHQPGWKRGIAAMSNIENSNQARSHITVIQDLGVVLTPKLVLARSLAEAGESTFLELIENVIVYYSIPFIASKGLKPLFKKLVPHLDEALLHKKLQDIPPHLRGKAAPAKAALILGALGLAIAVEAAVAYAKPLLTAHFTGKTDFSDVVGLKKDHTHKSSGEENLNFIHKMHKRLKYSVMAVFGVLTSSILLARYGHKAPKLEKPLSAFVKHLDFELNENGSIALGHNQMGYYMGAAILWYLSSCRDKLERVEVATRLAIVMPYLFLFRQMMTKSVNQRLAKQVPSAFKTVDGKLKSKSLEEIYQSGLAQARKAQPNLNETRLQPYIRGITDQAVNARLKSFGLPLATGIFGFGFGVGLLNIFWTQYRYKHQNHVSTVHTPTLPSMPTQTQQNKTFRFQA